MVNSHRDIKRHDNLFGRGLERSKKCARRISGVLSQLMSRDQVASTTSFKFQQPLQLSTIPSDLRDIILDYVLDRDVIVFEPPLDYRYTSRGWSLAFMQTSRQLYSEGLTALSRAFRRTTIKYSHCSPIRHQLRNLYPLHYKLMQQYGHLFESMEIIPYAYDEIDLALFPNIKRLTIGNFSHEIWSLDLPITEFPQFSDISDKRILEAWDAVQRRIAVVPHLQFPVAIWVKNVIDGTGWGPKEKDWKLFIRVLVQPRTSRVSAISCSIGVDRAETSDSMR